MPHDAMRPLLRLNAPKVVDRPTGKQKKIPQPTRFKLADQVRAHGPVFQRLRDALNQGDAALQLRADPMSLAPERVLVFEVKGPVQDFAKAVAKITGLEFAGEEELESGEPDEHPELYLLVPQLEALKQILSLWERWAKTGELPQGYAPWRNLFFLLRAVRPWGPQDRVSPANREYFQRYVEGAPDNELIRIEVELVFR